VLAAGDKTMKNLIWATLNNKDLIMELVNQEDHMIAQILRLGLFQQIELS